MSDDPSGYVGVESWAQTLSLRDSDYCRSHWSMRTEAERERWREIAREEIASGHGPIQPGTVSR